MLNVSLALVFFAMLACALVSSEASAASAATGSKWYDAPPSDETKTLGWINGIVNGVGGRGAGITSLFRDADEMEQKKQDARYELFGDFGGNMPGTSGWYTDMICKSKIPKTALAGGIAYANTGSEANLAAFINCRRYFQANFSENNVTGEVESHNSSLYKLSYKVVNSNPKQDITYKVVFDASFTAVNETSISSGSSSGATGSGMLLIYSNQSYSKACIKITSGSLKVYDNGKLVEATEICNRIPNVAGTASTYE